MEKSESFEVLFDVKPACSELFYIVLIEAFEIHSTQVQIDIAKCIKNLSQEPQNFENFDHCDMVERLCQNLWRDSIEIRIQILNTLFYLLRLDASRQERAVACGILDFLNHSNNFNNSTKQFAIPILCGLIRNSESFASFWETEILATLLELVGDLCWKNVALDALIYWHSKEPKKIEYFIFNTKAGTKLNERLFSAQISNDADQFTSQIFRLMFQSPALCEYLLKCGIVSMLLPLLSDRQLPAQVLMMLLKILDLLTHPSLHLHWHNNEQQRGILVPAVANAAKVRSCIERHSQNQSVLVRGLVARIITTLGKLNKSIH